MQQIDNKAAAAQGGIKPADIIYILFRRKWLILFFTLLGIAGAAFYYTQVPPTYSSQAKLFIRYVLEKKLPTGTGTESSIRQNDGGSILASEVEVLTSYDLATEVAQKVGPQKILGGDPSATPQSAARVITKGLKIDVPSRSDVVRITFEHSDPTVVQPVLKQLIASYLSKHDEIHRTAGLFDDVLTQQTDSLRSEVARTEEDLRKLKLKTGISSLEDSKKAYTVEISQIRQEINDTIAQIAERQASFASMRQSFTPAAQTNQPTVTNTGPAQVPAEIITQYRVVVTKLETLRQRELSLSQQFTGENLLVKAVQAQIADATKQQLQLETAHPGLLASATGGPAGRAGNQNQAAVFDPITENARMAALQAKLDTLQKLLEKSTSEIKAIQEAEPELLRLQRKRDMDETKYRQFQTSLEQARFDESLGAGRLSNIGVAQNPSPAAREARKTLKTIGMILAAGLGLGLALAFLIEMYLRPSVKTASELERRFRTEVFLSIPSLRLNGHASRKALLEKNSNSRKRGKEETGGEADSHVVPWNPDNPLQPYYEGLRDRVMTWFDNKGLVKKPKLVAVTSCESGAGVSSIAAGLAATFSETGDGRVLLVDMNVGQGAAHSFYKGKPGCGLDEAVEGDKMESAQVNDNLYVVAESAANSDKLPSVLPRRFTSLVPKLKATDFDYIIFDMPPVSPITMTPRLSAFMDMVLLVVEAEKTTPDKLKTATNLLGQSRANVAAVMNKTRVRAPKCIAAG